jgi:hypothetical protein
VRINAQLIDAAMGPYKGKCTGEYGLFRRIREAFVEGEIMLADSYFCSYFLIADMLKRGVDVLFEQHGARTTDFRRGKHLGKRDHLVCWSKPRIRPDWMSLDEYHSFPAQITVREMIRVGNRPGRLEPRSVKRRPKPYPRLHCHRWKAREDIKKYGHAEKLRAN